MDIQATGTRAGYSLEEQVGFLLRVAMQRHTVIFTSQMIENLTQTQFAALAKLHALGPCSQNELGRRIFLDAATIKGVVERLRARGFVVSSSDPRDRRRSEVALTDAGRATVLEAERIALKITADTLAPLTQRERQALVSILRKLA